MFRVFSDLPSKRVLGLLRVLSCFGWGRPPAARDRPVTFSFTLQFFLVKATVVGDKSRDTLLFPSSMSKTSNSSSSRCSSGRFEVFVLIRVIGELLIALLASRDAAARKRAARSSASCTVFFSDAIAS
jgi:hypothetical protein